jgi:murein DD-endopeptidase MepM/ murein hydrolase activator NlpD
MRGTHGGLRKTLIPGIPSAPTLIGAAALLLAAAGAVTVSAPDAGAQPASGNIQKLSAQASVLSGASSIGSSNSLSGRARAVSRDSQREAQQDAADENLQAAAEKQAKQRNAALAALAASAEKQATLIAKNFWQLPVQAGAYHLTSRFGECSGLWSHCHTGLDFAAPSGTPIHAIANGTVTSVGYDGSYGNKTVVTLEDGTELWYCHQTAYAVSSGQQVRAGEVIGSVGSTGNVTGPHVHVEVRPGAGDPVDPYAALVAHGVQP